MELGSKVRSFLAIEKSTLLIVVGLLLIGLGFLDVEMTGLNLTRVAKSDTGFQLSFVLVGFLLLLIGLLIYWAEKLSKKKSENTMYTPEWFEDYETYRDDNLRLPFVTCIDLPANEIRTIFGKVQRDGDASVDSVVRARLSARNLVYLENDRYLFSGIFKERLTGIIATFGSSVFFFLIGVRLYLLNYKLDQGVVYTPLELMYELLMFMVLFYIFYVSEKISRSFLRARWLVNYFRV